MLKEKKHITYTIPKGDASLKERIIHWMMKFDYACLLDSHDENTPLIIAVGNQEGIVIKNHDDNAFSQLQEWYDKNNGKWSFGFLSYDLKNNIEDLFSENKDGIKMPLLHFFIPEIRLELLNEKLIIYSAENEEKILDNILKTPTNGYCPCKEEWEIKSRETKEQYEEKIKKIKEHIFKGDIYEMNYCTEFFIENCDVSPATLFYELNRIAKAPFSSFYKWKNKFLCCGSPERFIKKEKNKLISQPIKGTAPRGKNKIEDNSYKKKLKSSSKDKSENVMIVDLVRNDLGRSCKAGTVNVDELFGIYGFEQVWQMISTISGELREDIHPIEALKNAFPMGSMTGAPKIRAMELIEKYEETKRGLYSGAVGYITPEGDFDFNVVIRSILYNALNQYLSFHVGGAIVAASEPEAEYEECLLKAETMFRALGVE